jgi:hypothetical protein
MSEFVARAPATWTVDHVPADNTLALAVKAAAAKTRHFITGVSFSGIGAIAAVTVQLKHGATVVMTWKIDIDAAYDFDFTRPLRNLNANELVSLTVSDPGASNAVTATIRGFSKME